MHTDNYPNQHTKIMNISTQSAKSGQWTHISGQVSSTAIHRDTDTITQSWSTSVLVHRRFPYEYTRTSSTSTKRHRLHRYTTKTPNTAVGLYKCVIHMSHPQQHPKALSIREDRQPRQRRATKTAPVTYLLSWCFEPSQPRRILSGLQTNSIYFLVFFCLFYQTTSLCQMSHQINWRYTLHIS